jgi:hypothetical protein
VPSPFPPGGSAAARYGVHGPMSNLPLGTPKSPDTKREVPPTWGTRNGGGTEAAVRVMARSTMD